MPSLFRIIRGAEIGRERILPLDLRRDFFPPRDGEAEGNGAGRAAKGAAERTRAAQAAQAAEVAEALARARAGAEEIIIRARAEAKELLREAQAQAAELAAGAAAQARAEGYQKGYAEGYQEGLAKAMAEGEATRREAGEVLRQAGEIWQKTLENMESEIVSLAREIAEKILAAQLTLDPAAVLAIVREALELARNRERVVLYVNPADAGFVQQRREELLPALSPQADLHIISDAGVEQGGCRVETEDRTVEATLKERWRVLREALQA